MQISKPYPIILLLLSSFLLLTACRAKSQEPVTFDGWASIDIPTLDPQLAEDIASINYIENLFMQLTNYDLETSQIVPEAATDWVISADGLTYTFSIRSDIPWVRYDPIAKKIVRDTDPQGQPRFLSAHDFVYGIKRACDPNIGSYYSAVVAPLIKGCSEVLFFEHPDHIPRDLWDNVGVHAPDDQTLIIELAFPASYFLSMTPMWTMAATPEWAIKAHEKDWIEAANIVTNGRFVLQEWEHDVQRTLLRNPFLPKDLHGDGNIQRFVTSVAPDEDTGYSLWLDKKADFSSIPQEKLPDHLERFPEETDFVPGLAVSYIGFRMTKPPFDDVRVRRAFSAAFDRETFVNEVLHGQGLPMIHFAPPGIFGAPPIDQVGLGFDPDFARQQLAEAGYPECRGFPKVTLVGFSDKNSLVEYAQAQWQEHLGCDQDRITVSHLTFRELLSITANDAADANAPHMWTLAWTPDYADENNWVGDVLWCRVATRQKRTCNEIDESIVAARKEADLQRRIQQYRQIEEDFFGPDGEMPLIPISLRTHLIARHPWLDWAPSRFGGDHWYAWSIDQSAKRAAQH